MFGNYYGKKEIVALMLDHPIAKLSYSEIEKKIIRNFGHLIFSFFGYPLIVSSRQRSDLIIKYLDPKPKERILDIGCGIGYYTFELSSKFDCEVEGIDLDAEDIKLANKIKDIMKNTNVNFRVSDVLKLDYPDDSFDKIIMSEVLEHIRDDQKVLMDLNRILKSNGYMIISSPYAEVVEEYVDQKHKLNLNKDLNINGGHVRNGYSIERISDLLEKSRFNIVTYSFVGKKFTYDVGFPLFIFAYPISLLDRFLKGTGKGIILKVKKISKIPNNIKR